MKNDLLMIEMDTKEVRQIHPDLADENVPPGTLSHTLTKISSGRAILYGGNGGFVSEEGVVGHGGAFVEAWILFFDKVLNRNYTQPKDLWSRVETSCDLDPRMAHSAVLDPSSQRLHIFGGGVFNNSEWASPNRTQVVSFTTAPLKLLAMERAIARYAPEDPDLEEFLPTGHPIRRTFEARRRASTLESMTTVSWLESQDSRKTY